KHAVMRDRARIPKPRNLRLALPLQRKNAPWFELMHALINRIRRRYVIVPHERGHRVTVDFRRPAGMGAQCLQFRAEQKKWPEFCPIQRLDTEPIADERERAIAAVPQ